MTANFREARYNDERRILRLRVAIADEYEAKAPRAAKLLAKTEGRSLQNDNDYCIQFDGVDIKLFHGLPVGETALSYIISRIRGHHTMVRLTNECYEKDQNENDAPPFGARPGSEHA